MITEALAAYIRSISSLSVYIERAPLDSQPCIVIDDNGDFRERHWDNGETVSGMREHEFDLTVWTDLNGGGPRYASQQATAIADILDNFSGPLIDSQSSPNVTHNISHIEVSDDGGGFDAGPELWAHGLTLTVMYK